MRDGLAVLYQGGSEFFADRDHPARFPLARCVLEADGPADPALGVVGHPPSEPGDLLGPEAGFGRKEEYQPIPLRPTGLGQVTQDGFRLPLA
jgi:hypothetical protein